MLMAHLHPMPDVTLSRTTKIEIAGGLGKVVNFFAKGAMESAETIYVRGNQMRTDMDDQATIVDLDGRQFINLNKKQDYGGCKRADGRGAGGADAEYGSGGGSAA
jgi:hypothetical protein